MVEYLSKNRFLSKSIAKCNPIFDPLTYPYQLDQAVLIGISSVVCSVNGGLDCLLLLYSSPILFIANDIPSKTNPASILLL